MIASSGFLRMARKTHKCVCTLSLAMCCSVWPQDAGSKKGITRCVPLTLYLHNYEPRGTFLLDTLPVYGGVF